METEKGKILREAVMTLDPQKIREAGERTGHPVRVESDTEIVYLAAQLILFFIHDAPDEVLREAEDVLGISGTFFRGFYR